MSRWHFFDRRGPGVPFSHIKYGAMRQVWETFAYRSLSQMGPPHDPAIAELSKLAEKGHITDNIAGATVWHKTIERFFPRGRYPHTITTQLLESGRKPFVYSRTLLCSFYEDRYGEWFAIWPALTLYKTRWKNVINFDWLVFRRRGRLPIPWAETFAGPSLIVSGGMGSMRSCPFGEHMDKEP